MFNKLTENEKDIQKIKIDLSNIIFDTPEQRNNESNLKNINTCLFNAKKYIEFLNEKEKICNIKNLFIEFRKIKKRKKKIS